jgi:hypothetical protein
MAERNMLDILPLAISSQVVLAISLRLDKKEIGVARSGDI